MLPSSAITLLSLKAMILAGGPKKPGTRSSEKSTLPFFFVFRRSNNLWLTEKSRINAVLQ
jgi:hypothetical protein